MSSGTFTAANDAAIVYDSGPYNRREFSIGRFANIAATVAIVFAVTVGGWFAMSQLPPGGDGRFAALQGTPEVAQSAICDVEPLTVDEVVAIVENPYSAVEPTWWATPAPDSGVSAEGLAHNQEFLDFSDAQMTILPSPSQAAYSVPEEETFADASVAANNVINCMAYGTHGQVWALMEPTLIQLYMLSPFPVYRDVATIRSYIEERIDQDYSTPGSYFAHNSDLIFTANPRRGDARIWITDSPEILDYDKVMLIGMHATDADGDTVFTDDWAATTVEGDQMRSNGTAVALVHSESTGKWYFITGYAPRG